MASDWFNVEVEISGKITDPTLGGQAMRAISRGLLELATIEGQTIVQSQLYPGHGFVTGHLYKHISATLPSQLVAQFDAGKGRFGENVVYAGSVEHKYRMFENAEHRLKSETKLWKEYIGGELMKVFN
jgi:hypothetical protein|tara:strand:- start:875 stop:1258 length:384 start_codon:yes stop_codon:yes gene_type:complete